MNYAPIHNHSEFSALDGLSTCKEIMERCQCIGCGSVGITDHGTVSGHLEFAKQAYAHDIKPIFGCELYHGIYYTKEERVAAIGRARDQAHLVSLAKTDQGLRSLWSLVSEASENSYFVGRVNWDLLEKYKEGLVLTSGCIQGLVAQDVMAEGDLDPLNRYLDIFKDDFYMEIHTYPGEEHERLNSDLVDIAWERGIPLVYATDAHYATPEQYDVHDAFVAMQTRDSIMIDPEDRKMWHPKSLYIQDEEQIRKSLSYLPEKAVDEALANSHELAESCNASLPEIKKHLPVFLPKESPWTTKEEKKMDAAELFIKRVEEGVAEHYGEDADEEVWDRAANEMEVFLDGGLEHYFLQAWDFVQFCEKEGIERGPGRGSAGGAIISNLLGITDLDPLEYGLIFERFYNPGRADGFPDIDSDFPTAMRPKIKKYMEGRWGIDKVAQIGTITRLKPLSAIEKVHKIFVPEISYSDRDRLKKIVRAVPDIDILGSDSIGWSEDIDPGKTIYVMDHVGKEVEEWIESVDHPFGMENHQIDESIRGLAQKMVDLVSVICSRVSGYGIHPSGVVVSDVALRDELPLMWNSNQKTLATMFPMKDVDKRQFVKQDFLGLANLDVLSEWKELTKDEDLVTDWGEIKKMVEDNDSRDGQDHPMWDLFDKGLTLGLFQIEDGYARRLCKDFKPRSIEDLGVIVALNRPGPIRSGAPDSFIARRGGDEEVTYDHPILEDILEETYGWFLYQEDVIKFFSVLGYNLSDADAVRKILGKKKPEEMRALYNGTGEWKGKGYQKMAEAAGIDEEARETIWSKIEDFAKYSFNKSHAIAYATLCFRTAYAKWASTAHFVIACIRVATNQKKSKEEIGLYVSESRRMGIPVNLPNIDKSQAEISYIDDEIYYGFTDIKGIGKGAANFICQLRDEYDLEDGADLHLAIECEQEEWEEEKEAAKEEGKPFKKKSPRQTLPQNRIAPLEDIGAFDEYLDRNISIRKQQDFEKELLGIIITDECDEILEANGELIDRLDDYESLEEEGTAKVAGIISSVTPRKTRKDGKSMGVVTIEYQGQQVEFVVFPQDWKNYKFLWKERQVAVFTLVNGERGVRFKEGVMLKND